MNLNIVVHAEEEFDWDGCFSPRNTSVTHGGDLVTFCESIKSSDCKIILAMDYAFVGSESGRDVINHFKNKKNVEFAAHLHPWVNPPIFSAEDEPVDEFETYPGNLPEEVEREKLKILTELITKVVGIKPATYLAGRYGVGRNSYRILSDLGYKKDLSISAFSDFRHQQGPDFSDFDNSSKNIEGIHCVPHTTGYISFIAAFSNCLNRDAIKVHKLNSNFLGKVILKILGVKRVRLSPEGFSFREMKKLTQSLLSIGIEEFILSFHSPSVKIGMTPYVKTRDELNQFKDNTLNYLRWFNEYKLNTSQI